jgi:hypothetical protein
MPEYSFTVTEHDTDRPWIVVGSDHCKVVLEDAASFYEWAHQQWPAPRWTVELDPGQLLRWPAATDG